MNYSVALGYVAAMIDGEGCVSGSANHRCIRVSNTNLEIVEAYEAALRMIGIPYRRLAQEYYADLQQDMRIIYTVTIWGRKHLERVSEIVPIVASAKRERLAWLLGLYSYDHYYQKHEITYERLAALVDRGLTQREIAIELGMKSHGNAQYHLEKHGLKTARGRVL